MTNVWVKAHHGGLVNAACIIRIDDDGTALQVWHRAGGDAAISAVKICEVPDLNAKLPEHFAEQLAALIAHKTGSFAVIQAVHGPSGWRWESDTRGWDALQNSWEAARKTAQSPAPPA